MVLTRMKDFCSRILKTLAPPLLRKVESTLALRVDVEPYTPRCSTRLSTLSKPARSMKKASAAEKALLKALGVAPENHTVEDDVVWEFKQFFDSRL
jgi:hypothetical protein